MSEPATRTLYVFDFDDTLITNQSVDLEVFNTVLAKHHLPLLTGQKLLALRQKGLLAEDIFRQIVRDPIGPLLEERRALLNDVPIWKHAVLNKGVKAALSIIKSRQQTVIVITKKEARLTERILDLLGIRMFIDEVHTSDEKHVLLAALLQQHPSDKVVFVSDDVEELRHMQRLPVTTYCFASAYKDQRAMSAMLIRSLEEIL
jgi:phosphoglycolate phosphatase-like HAD superfamily hydrolase